MLGVGVSFGIAAKLTHRNSNVVVISGDGDRATVAGAKRGTR